MCKNIVFMRISDIMCPVFTNFFIIFLNAIDKMHNGV